MTKLGLVVFLLCACKDKPKETPPPAPSPKPGPAPVVAADAAAPAPPKPAPPDFDAKVAAVMPTIKKIAADPEVVKAVRQQNGKKLSLDAIKLLDKEWTAATGVSEAMKPYLEGACTKAIAKYKSPLPAIVEAFAMDNQGALVCSINKTSDYWQGDEDKWQKSFADGKGSDFVDKPKFDDSSQAYSVQVSVPVSDGGKVIGAITV